MDLLSKVGTASVSLRHQSPVTDPTCYAKAMSVYFATPKMKAMVMTSLLKLSTR